MDTVETLRAALEHHRQGQLGQAERMCRQVLAIAPHRSDALFCSDSSRSKRTALWRPRGFARAVALAPAHAAVRAGLGEAFRRLGRPDEAGAAFFAALALQPDLAEAVFHLGLLFEELGRADDALGCFRRAAELRPDSAAIQARVAAARNKVAGSGKVSWPVGAAAASVLVEVATALRARGDHDGAVGLCRRALDLRPRFPEALSVLGAAQTELTLVDEAIATFRRALTLSPDSAELHANLGTALAAAGLIDEAIESTRKALALFPGPAHARQSRIFPAV